MALPLHSLIGQRIHFFCKHPFLFFLHSTHPNPGAFWGVSRETFLAILGLFVLGLIVLICCTCFRCSVRTASVHLGVLAHQFLVPKPICHKLQNALFPVCRGRFLAFFGQFWVFLRADWNICEISAHHMETISECPTLPDSFFNRSCAKHVIAFHFPKHSQKLLGSLSFLFFI